MSSSRRVVGAVASGLVLAASLLVPSLGSPDQAPGSVIEPELREVLAVREQARFIVELAGRADLAPAPAIAGFAERGQFVLDALRGTAARAQRAALALAAHRGAEAESFWLRNQLAVTGDWQLAEDLAELPGVLRVRTERHYPLVEPVNRTAVAEVATAAPEWGVSQIGADQVWELGVAGAGVLVATIDTGVDFTHPALIDSYQGNLGGGEFVHDYHWWDPTGTCGPVPCDNVDHGTHVTGTIAGGDGLGPFTPDVGVAPGVRWIAAKGCETINCSETSLLSAGQFVLAPTDLQGENPDPSRRPQIVNNSWGGEPDDPMYLDTVRAWRAAGIIPVFASGNPGSTCGAGAAPGNFPESFSVGATDRQDRIAGFSGRGPSPFGKANPDVTAPGVDVTSSVPRGGYAAFDGTSMAAPHVTGTLALMLSAAPELSRQVDPVLAAVRATALDIVDLTCGGDPDGDPNNVYGDGRIDALAAVRQVTSGGGLAGAITGEDGQPVPGARITADDGTRTFLATGDEAGRYELLLAAGRYTVSVSAFGYHESESTVEVVADETRTHDVRLAPLPRSTVTGRVLSTALGDRRLPGATVAPVGVPVAPATAGANGRYALTLPHGSYTLRATLGGCTTPVEVTVDVDRDRTANFWLTPRIDDFGHGCRSIDLDWHEVGTPTGLSGDDVYGRLELPFSFPFYGQRYSEVFVVSNGFLSFTDPLVAWSRPSTIPRSGLPNAGVFPLWTDLVVDEQASIEYGIQVRDERRAFVVEYTNLAEFGVGGRVDFQVKLWDDGRIDMLYRNNSGRPGDGSTALIGIEDAAGRDALPFSSQEPILGQDVAYRYEPVLTGVVSGVVTNRNDGQPVAGARVVAEPSGRLATTGADGRYTLRLPPGAYRLEVSAPDYQPGATDHWLTPRRRATVDFALRAGQAGLAPGRVQVSTELGASATEQIQLTNTGSAPLTFQVVEEDQGRTPPELPPAALPPVVTSTGEPVVRPVTWSRFRSPAVAGLPTAPGGPASDQPLPLVIDDPDHDAEGGEVELTAVYGGSDGRSTLSVALEFDSATPLGEVGGYVHFDVDQDPTTGEFVQNFFGKSTQDVKVEYLADLWPVAPLGKVMILDARTGAITAQLDAHVDGSRVRFEVPLAALGGDDGAVNLTTVVGNGARPTDWGPDAGHGTIEPDLDAAWMSLAPVTGTLAPGESQPLAIALGGSGVDVGTYQGRLEITTNDPRQPVHQVEVELAVTVPADFGGLRGTVTDERDGTPVPGTITIHSEWNGEPYPIVAQAGEDGGYLLFGPAGSWPAEFRADGYQPVTGEVTIAAGGTRTHDVALPALAPRATLDGAPVELTLAPGETASATLTLGNVAGLADLTYQISELAGGAAGVSQTGTALVLIDNQPFGTFALQEALTAEGIPHDIAGSADFGSIDLTRYEAVFVGNDQPPGFYDAFTEHLGWFEQYVQSGGFLWLGGAGWGSNGGSPDGVPVPGSGTIRGPETEEQNHLVVPDHPLVAGVADPITMEFASHAWFEGLPDGATTIAVGGDTGQPTLAEYDLGAGRVVVTGQPVEFGYQFDLDLGKVLANGVPYAMAFDPSTDLPWLAADPAGGTVPAGTSQQIAVSVDASGLASGTHQATLVIATNDPVEHRFDVPVVVTVR